MTALYERHAVSMIRIALIMLGDRAAAEDVVQDAFFGLYRRWRRAWVQPRPAAASGGAWPPG